MGKGQVEGSACLLIQIWSGCILTNVMVKSFEFFSPS